MRLAKRGQLHPDPVVAATSIAWAAEVVGQDISPTSDWIAAGLTEVIGSVVADTAGLGGMNVGASGGRWAERRVAMRILKAVKSTPPTQGP
jgi:hypothetical protein